MRLAEDDIVLVLGLSSQVTLRPSLRAAFRLENRYGGFEKLARAVADGSLTAVCDLMTESSDTPMAAVFEAASGSLSDFINTHSLPLVMHVYRLAGLDPEKPLWANGGSRLTFAEYHAKVFRIATGWLGWTPKEAWSATPAEIIEAYNGRCELFAAIFGSSPSDDASAPERPDEATLDRSGLAGLKVMGRAS